MPKHRAETRTGFSFIELMIVLSIIGISIALIAPSLSPSAPDQLSAASRSLAADLLYARDLAMMHNTSYRFTFDTNNNIYYLAHSGGNASFDVLPGPPAGSSAQVSKDGKQWSFDLASLPQVRLPIKLQSVQANDGTQTEVTELEFGPLGQTTSTTGTSVWLATGNRGDLRYQPIAVNPVTGMPRIQSIESRNPRKSAANTESESVTDGISDGGSVSGDTYPVADLPTSDGNAVPDADPDNSTPEYEEPEPIAPFDGPVTNY